MLLNRRFGLFYAIGSLWLTAALAIPAAADNLFAENFESYAVGSDLYGQGGWTGGHFNGSSIVGIPDPTPIDSGPPFSSQFLNGHISETAHENLLEHSLSHAVDPSQITIMTFDAYAWSNTHNFIVGFNNGADDIARLAWNSDETIGGWYFDARGITGVATDFINVPGGYNSVVNFGLVVDGANDTVYGTYDYGSGTQFTPAFSVTPAQISVLDSVVIDMDHRFGASETGGGVDNIVVTSSAAAVPEAGTLLTFGGLLAGSVTVLIRRSRMRKLSA